MLATLTNTIRNIYNGIGQNIWYYVGRADTNKTEIIQIGDEPLVEYFLLVHSTKSRTKRKEHMMKRDIITVDLLGQTDDRKIADMIDAMERKNRRTVESVSFSGGGYNCVYHLGVVRYIFENPELFRDTKYLGASGGAGIISLIVCYADDPMRFEVLDQIVRTIIEMNGSDLKLHQQVEKYSKILESYITESKFEQRIRGLDRISISVTDITDVIPRNQIKNNFETYTQFLETIRASACIPFILDNTFRKIDGRIYLDGGLSNNLPVLNDETIRISCLNYPFLNAELYPKIISEIYYSFTPPTKNYVLNMHDLGYGDIDTHMKPHHKKLEQSEQDKELNRTINNLVDDF